MANKIFNIKIQKTQFLIIIKKNYYFLKNKINKNKIINKFD